MTAKMDYWKHRASSNVISVYTHKKNGKAGQMIALTKNTVWASDVGGAAVSGPVPTAVTGGEIPISAGVMLSNILKEGQITKSEYVLVVIV